ncbi:MAG: 50S ribosomal protein L25 [Melioribacteraceae bacterium]|nr:50S ribosomal protein L25 [Melioribacteraceae bacterium]
MSEITVQAQKRNLTTKSALTQLRRNGNVPGIFYSKGVEPIPIQLPEISLKPLVYTSETHIVNLKIDEQEIKSILKGVQFDPVTDRIIHCDFQGISADQEIEIEVPVVLEGQAKGVKEGGLLQHSLHKLTVSCLPSFIPEHITINVTDLGLGKAIHVKDIKIPNVKILQNEDVIVVSVTSPKAASEPTTLLPGEEMKEPEVISKGKQTEEEE